MIVTGLITEYNPFHFGHKLHLEKSKAIGNSDYTIAIMSGQFVQRGEPAIVDKWHRAEMAVAQGVDLVLELPTVFACQSAEYFASGAVRLLDKLNIVDNFCFGSELGSLDDLQQIAYVLTHPSDEFSNQLQYYLKQGLSFPAARSKALVELSASNTWQEILNNSNNILGIEYLKAILKYNLKIKPLTMQRKGANYNDLSLNHSISSATAIRNTIKSNGLESSKNLLPNSSYSLIQEFEDKFNGYNHLDNYSQLILYKILFAHKSLNKLPNFETGLDKRLYKFAHNLESASDLIENVKTKRYTYTRIQRFLIHSLLDLSKKKHDQMFDLGPNYIRPLATNSNGLKLLSLIKENSNLPIISKFASSITKTNDAFYESLNLDRLASDLYYLGLADSKNSKSNMDFKQSFIIKK